MYIHKYRTFISCPNLFTAAGYMSKDRLCPEDHVGTPLDGVVVSIVDPRNGLLFHRIELMKISCQTPFNELPIIRWIDSFCTYFGSEFSFSPWAVKVLNWPKALECFSHRLIFRRAGRKILPRVGNIEQEGQPFCMYVGQAKRWRLARVEKFVFAKRTW